jgi:hypothetical protein
VRLLNHTKTVVIEHDQQQQQQEHLHGDTALREQL